MSRIQNVTEYPEAGFAILRDNQGSFLAFRDSDNFELLDDDPGPMTWPKSWKTEQDLPTRYPVIDQELSFS